ADLPRLALRALVRREPRLHRTRVLRRALRALLPHARDLAQHLAERWAAEPVLRREVRPAVVHLAVGREERRQRPATLTGQRLHRALVTRVPIRPLVPVHLHRYEQLVDQPRRLLVLVTLAVHHVAPVAPHRADVEQDGALLAPRALERLLAPRQPIHRLCGTVPQERAALTRQRVPSLCAHHLPPSVAGRRRGRRVPGARSHAPVVFSPRTRTRPPASSTARPRGTRQPRPLRPAPACDRRSPARPPPGTRRSPGSRRSPARRSRHRGSPSHRSSAAPALPAAPAARPCGAAPHRTRSP